MKKCLLTSVLLFMAASGCSTFERISLFRRYQNTTASSSPVDTTITTVSERHDSKGQPALLLSAFYGLDDGLPRAADKGIGKGAGGADGMPAIFSHEIDPGSIQPGDFRITTASGSVGRIAWVTLAPADDRGEFRTVLFAGHFGSIGDQPVKLEVVGNVLSLDGMLNFKGASVSVIPLEDGPTMIRAELVPEDEWDVGKEATRLPWGRGSGAPKGTKQVVRVTWAGGITKPSGREIDDVERRLYRVTVIQPDGTKSEVCPFAIADLGDGDNNHELCLDVTGTPLAVYFPAGYMADPRRDLNPETKILIQK